MQDQDALQLTVNQPSLHGLDDQLLEFSQNLDH
jgi:hypothetical protein